MKTADGFFSKIGIPAAVALLAAVPVVTAVPAGPAPVPAPAGDNRYIGAEQCKNCHKSEKSGNPHGTWAKSKHAKAWETLAGDEAKKIGKEKGVEDPQKSETCLKCHVTAFGKPPEVLGKKFDPKLGVQCETCHGPGEKHFKARFAAAQEAPEGEEPDYQAVPEDEIVARPGKDVCTSCHNPDAPSFKKFCFKKGWEEIGHLDPRKKRSEAERAAMKCDCGDDTKCQCKAAECGDLAAPK